jgi:hypothetical protein
MMALVKKEHYLTDHLPQFIESRLHTPFVWGSNDCALFAADAVLAATGVDIAEDFRGKYDSKLGAFRTIKEVTGGSTIEDAAAYCAEKHGLKECQFPLMAKRGDLVIVHNNLGEKVAGIVGLNGRHVYVPGDNGLVHFSIMGVIRAWSVGDAHEWTPPKWHKDAK